MWVCLSVCLREPHALSAEVKGRGSSPFPVDPTVLRSCITGGTRGGGGGGRMQRCGTIRGGGGSQEGLRGTAKDFFFFFFFFFTDCPLTNIRRIALSIHVQYTCSRQRLGPYASLLEEHGEVEESSDSWGSEMEVRGAGFLWSCLRAVVSLLSPGQLQRRCAAARSRADRSSPPGQGAQWRGCGSGQTGAGGKWGRRLRRWHWRPRQTRWWCRDLALCCRHLCEGRKLVNVSLEINRQKQA
ncbi:hypothetical protein ATANTOWER_023646 [Ataeniobius toweri]|uniref:Uncharacterized protein n=1 Tax=Ataeniobius toweri TaxID=208326 RepID=A0ABU7BIZ4_9TELE|nr:hypothetical protein [Ataeniobius toweri]